MSSEQALPHIFKPGRIGTMEIRNRIIMPAMAGMGPSHEGFVTDITKGFYEARAKGGVGMVIIGNTPVNWAIGRSGKYRILIEDDRFLLGLTEVVNVIHKHGAKAAAQINHAGPSAFLEDPNTKTIAASAVARPPDHLRKDYPPPREMTISEIEEMIGVFARAAVRAKKAGFDGIEVHAAHRYLINSFISPYFNRRQDKYGGDLNNRARFLIEVLTAIRNEVGKEYPVWLRMTGKENGVQGITSDLAQQLAQLLEKTGMVDALHLSQWPPMWLDPPGYAVPYAEAVKQVVKLPVIGVGMIDVPLAEKILMEGKVDFVAIGRRLIADPELPNKAAAGKTKDINPCQRCNNCQMISECTVNPSFLREYKYELKPTEKPRRVLVVGGGPGGMEVSRVAALRGHEVYLYEQHRRLGGQLELASVLRDQGSTLAEYQARQIQKAGVKVTLGKCVDRALVEQINPDAIVIASGAISSVQEIKSTNHNIVMSATDISDMMHGKFDTSKGVSPRRLVWYAGIVFMKVFGPSAMRLALKVWAPFGNKIIVMGTKLHSIEIAHFMAKKNKKITILDTVEKLPPHISAVVSGDFSAVRPMPHLREKYTEELENMGTKIILGVKQYKEINKKGLVYIDKTGAEQTIEADTIVCAADYNPNLELMTALRETKAAIYLVGDCNKPSGICEAMSDGARIGREL